MPLSNCNEVAAIKRLKTPLEPTLKKVKIQHGNHFFIHFFRALFVAAKSGEEINLPHTILLELKFRFLSKPGHLFDIFLKPGNTNGESIENLE